MRRHSWRSLYDPALCCTPTMDAVIRLWWLLLLLLLMHLSCSTVFVTSRRFSAPAVRRRMKWKSASVLSLIWQKRQDADWQSALTSLGRRKTYIGTIYTELSWRLQRISVYYVGRSLYIQLQSTDRWAFREILPAWRWYIEYCGVWRHLCSPIVSFHSSLRCKLHCTHWLIDSRLMFVLLEPR